MSYRNVSVLITGGLGFIGSNLAIRLVEAGARVTIVDPSVPGCGANLFNIDPVRHDVELIARDCGDAETFPQAIRRADLIFNLAGEISHIHSMEFPERDLLINGVSQLRFLQACVRYNPGVRIVYAGTRQVYGKPDYLPMDERHPVRPVDFNGVHKYAANMYHLMLSRSGHLDAIVLRLTNVYGPRMTLRIPCQGFLSTFFRRVLTGQPLEVFGDGQQLRDPVYVDDAIEAFLLSGKCAAPEGRTYNVGGARALSLLQIAEICAQLGGSLPVSLRPFPPDRASIDIGSYYTDSRLIERDLGWKPKTEFQQGAATTLAYYREHLAEYLDPANPEPFCSLPEHQGVQRKLMYATVPEEN
ncbi:MAG: GDP-mannose 4,6-dehydratase [Bryobacteraceae bacterium]|nr:GDP-mannose 4,6-dehydratase [Bryobacteraceae bacterium]MDW8378322.1 GDP-mannose 4,6-dehydratase [Bryobacterales bacterium]